MISFKESGDFKNLEKLLSFSKRANIEAILNKYGQIGVEALSASTPSRSGKTASSWNYKVTRNKGNLQIDWYNTNTNKGENIAILIQYGHGTGTGGYVHGIDYVNPAMKPIFDRLSRDLWMEVNA